MRIVAQNTLPNVKSIKLHVTKTSGWGGGAGYSVNYAANPERLWYNL